MSAFISDCLVLKLEEIEEDTKNIDTTVYIIYDKRNHTYLIRGRRAISPKRQSCSYSYECDNAIDVANFLRYLICKHNKVNEILYNYDNLPENPNDITFEFLNEYDEPDYEISGYNDKKLKRRGLLNNLRMLRNVYNYY